MRVEPLPADDTGDHQHEGQNDIDGIVGRGLDDDGIGGHEDDLEQRGADDDIGRDAQEIDHCRHHDEAAADTHHRCQDADAEAECCDRDDAQIDLGFFEPHLQRQAMDPIVMARPLQRHGFVLGRTPQRIDALPQHQRPDSAEQQHIGKRNHQIELADAPQQRKDPDADCRPGQTAAEQHGPELDIDRAAPEMGDGAGDRGGDDLVCAGGDGNDRRDIVENQERRDQEAAADTEHAGQEADGRAHSQNDENVHRQLCDGQIHRHGQTSKYANSPQGGRKTSKWQVIHHGR